MIRNPSPAPVARSGSQLRPSFALPCCTAFRAASCAIRYIARLNSSVGTGTSSATSTRHTMLNTVSISRPNGASPAANPPDASSTGTSILAKFRTCSTPAFTSSTSCCSASNVSTPCAVLMNSDCSRPTSAASVPTPKGAASSSPQNSAPPSPCSPATTSQNPCRENLLRPQTHDSSSSLTKNRHPLHQQRAAVSLILQRVLSATAQTPQTGPGPS